ncbi:MAG: hypothetical protein QOJ25_916 [Solirubrobacteraceae bacterium]|nr:hypothetical protein [Solirubrobacteraceae bacterium]
MSASTVQLTASAPAGAGRRSAGTALRPTSLRVYAALVLGSLVLGSVSLLYPSTPSYDPWGWLLWGREILHLDLNTVGANTFKPFPVLFTLPFALFGKAQPDLWLALARAGAIFAVLMAFKLAARLTLWLGASPDGRQGVSRVVAYGPALLSGAVAALSLLIAAQYVRDAALGYSECLGAGLVLLAIDRHLDGKPRQTFVIGFFPALDRPEIWAFWGLYGVYLWFRDPGARKLVAALFALIPILWFGPEYWGSGHFFRGVTRALHPRQNAATFANCPFCTELRGAWHLTLTRVKVVGAVTALGAAIALVPALRSRSRAQGRPELVLVVMGVMAIVWFLEISAMTQAGFSGNQRYLIIGGALVVVLGGVGWGVAAWKAGELIGRLVRQAPGTAIATAAAAAVFLVLPDWVGSHFPGHKLDHALRYQAELRQDLPAVINRAGGAKKLVACGEIETEKFQKQMVAWYLDVPSVKTPGASPDEIAGETVSGNPNVILQARDTGTARLQPAIPKNVRYTLIRQRTFRLYEHCK